MVSLLWGSLHLVDEQQGVLVVLILFNLNAHRQLGKLPENILQQSNLPVRAAAVATWRITGVHTHTHTFIKHIVVNDWSSRKVKKQTKKELTCIKRHFQFLLIKRQILEETPNKHCITMTLRNTVKKKNPRALWGIPGKLSCFSSVIIFNSSECKHLPKRDPAHEQTLVRTLNTKDK